MLNSDKTVVCQIRLQQPYKVFYCNRNFHFDEHLNSMQSQVGTMTVTDSSICNALDNKSAFPTILITNNIKSLQRAQNAAERVAMPAKHRDHSCSVSPTSAMCVKHQDLQIFGPKLNKCE